MVSKTDSPRKRQFASKVKMYRERLGLTQADVAQVAGVNREYIGSMELGRINVVYPEVFNKVKRALDAPGWDLLEAMGYDTDASFNKGIIAPLQVILADMSEPQQKIILDIAKTMRKGAEGAP